MTAAAWFARTAGLDRAVLLTLANRAISVIAGLVTIGFVGHFLSGAAQGYYYTFNTLITLQVLVELGLSFALAQLASHEMTRLAWGADGSLEGDAAAKQRMRSLLLFSLRWFGGAGLLMALVLVPFGLLFAFTGPAKTVSVSELAVPWTALVVLSAANLVVTATLSLLEGCGLVADVALVRLVQTIAGALATWTVLSMGGTLGALGAQAGALLVVGAAWLALTKRAFLADLLAFRSPLPAMDWRREIWPFHWRIAVSWASGFLIFNLFTPVLFATHGPVPAGRMGLSLQVAAALNGLAAAWISTKLPVYGALVARGDGRALDALFRRGLVQSLLALLACLAGLAFVVAGLTRLQSQWLERLLPVPLLAWLALIVIANHVIAAQAALLRAHKQEPFMPVSVATGLTAALLAALLIPGYGMTGAVGAYAVASIVIGLGAGTFVFMKKRSEWWASHDHT